MKKSFIIIFLVSLFLNGYFIYDQVKINEIEEQTKLINHAFFGDKISKATWKDGFKLFTAKLKRENDSLTNKKYFYINVWNTMCAPCIKEMPMLDSIAGAVKNTNFAYVFLSDNTDGAVKQSLKGKFDIGHFVYLNDMNDFVSAILNEKGQKFKEYPMQLITDREGKLYYFSTGAFEDVSEAKKLIETINKLK